MGRHQLEEGANEAGLVFMMAVCGWLLVSVVVVRALFRSRTQQRRFSPAYVIGVSMLVPVGLVVMFSTESGNHFLNVFVMRNALAHRVVLASSAVPSLSGDEVLVHVHIPRTAGDSTRTHGFRESMSIEFSPLWKRNGDSPPVPFSWSNCTNLFHYCKDAALCPEKFDQPDLIDPTFAQPPEFYYNEWMIDQPHLVEPLCNILYNASILKGYWSYEDIVEVKRLLEGHKKVRMFTFLRHPIERVISFFDFVGAGTIQTYFNFSSAMYNDTLRLAHTQSFCYNGMTWQLGDRMHIDYRSRSEQEALDQAKRFLDQMDFVGFYENLGHDFHTVQRDLLHEHLSLPSVVYWLGTLVGSARLKVLKYSQIVDPETLHAVEQLNLLDLELYEWARDRFKQPYTLYDSYRAYVYDHLLSLIFWGVCFAFVSLVVIWLLWACLKLVMSQLSTTQQEAKPADRLI